MRRPLPRYLSHQEEPSYSLHHRLHQVLLLCQQRQLEERLPPGFYFDLKLSVCNWPEVAVCVEGSLPEEPEKPSNPVPYGCEGRICNTDDCFEWANSNHCQDYCGCLYFNHATGDCDWPSNVDCEVPTNPPNGCADIACDGNDCFKGANTLDCNKYCNCDHGHITVGSCSEGLCFNLMTGACDFPANFPGESEDKPDNSNEEPGNSSEEELSKENPGKPGDCGGICSDIFPIQDNLHLAYSWDCTKFCHCANDGHWLKFCPSGLQFDAELQVCDWPKNAHCNV